MTEGMDLIHKQELIKERNQTAGKSSGLLFTHVNIRKSISLLLMKLVVIELIALVLIIVFYVLLLSAQTIQPVSPLLVFNPLIFSFFILGKLILMIYVVHDWHEEYYEISAQTVAHFKGDIFRRREVVRLDHIGSIKMEQGLFGRLFNFGTIRLHNWFLNRDYFLYQIHNPKKYEHLLEKLLPRADRMEKFVREHIVNDEDGS